MRLPLTAGRSKIREAITRIDPAAPLSLIDEARSHRNIGSVYQQLGRAEDAIAEWDRSIAIARPLLSQRLDQSVRHPQLTGRSDLSAIVREDLANVYLDRASLLRELGQNAAAPVSWRQSLELFEALHRERPAELGIRNRLADCYACGSVLMLNVGRFDESHELLTRSLEIREAMAAANPSVAAYRYALAENLITVSWIRGKLHREGEALAGYRKATELTEKLIADEPDSASIAPCWVRHSFNRARFC